MSVVLPPAMTRANDGPPARRQLLGPFDYGTAKCGSLRRVPRALEGSRRSSTPSARSPDRRPCSLGVRSLAGGCFAPEVRAVRTATQPVRLRRRKSSSASAMRPTPAEYLTARGYASLAAGYITSSID